MLCVQRKRRLRIRSQTDTLVVRLPQASTPTRHGDLPVSQFAFRVVHVRRLFIYLCILFLEYTNSRHHHRHREWVNARM